MQTADSDGWTSPPTRRSSPRSRAFAADARERYADLVLIGIGGSSLGAIATIQALADPVSQSIAAPRNAQNGPRFFVLDNPDPEKVAATLASVGSAQYADQCCHQIWTNRGDDGQFSRRAPGIGGGGRPRARSPADRGDHGDITKDCCEPWPIRRDTGQFPVPPGVDGRMTVLDAGDLLPAAMCSCDIDGLMAGARAMRARCTSPCTCGENPAYLLAALCVLASTRLGKSILVTMPYADALFGLSGLVPPALGRKSRQAVLARWRGGLRRADSDQGAGGDRPALPDPALHRGPQRQAAPV